MPSPDPSIALVSPRFRARVGSPVQACRLRFRSRHARSTRAACCAWPQLSSGRAARCRRRGRGRREATMAAANRELLAFDIATLSQMLRKRQLSPVEVTEAYLARIEETEQRLNAYLTVTA